MLNTRFFDQFDEFRRSFDRLFENSTWSAPRENGAGATDWAFTPVVETGWNDNHVNLRFVLPAVSEKDIEVTVQGNQLAVRGERKAPEGFGNEGYAYHRLPYGRFERAVDLPNGLNTGKLQAHLHDGVLDIQIPVYEDMKPKKVQITAGKEPAAIAA